MSLNVVVAHYCGNLNWLNKYSEQCYIYNKSGKQTGFVNDIKVPNVGLDGFCFLKHIIDNYDALADVTVFVQDEVEDHGYDQSSLVKYLATHPFTLKSGTSPNVCTWLVDIPSYTNLDESEHRIHGCALTMLEFWKRYIHPSFIIPSTMFMWYKNMIFAATCEAIRRRPKSYYQILMQKEGLDSVVKPVGLHYLERSLFYILNPIHNEQTFYEEMNKKAALFKMYVPNYGWNPMNESIYLSIGKIVTPYPKYIKQEIKEPKLHVITVITDENNKRYRMLMESAEMQNIKIRPLVSKLPVGHGNGGFGMKLKMMANFVQGIDDDDVILFIDGYDVLITGTSNTIISRYKELIGSEKKAVFGAEVYPWPDKDKGDMYPDHVKQLKSPFKFLNSGCYISYCSVLRNLFDSMKLDSYSQSELISIDDQRMWTNTYFNNTHLIILDHNNYLFCCMVDILHHLEIRNNHWYNTLTETFPLVFHANGSFIIKNFLFDRIFPTIKNRLL